MIGGGDGVGAIGDAAAVVSGNTVVVVAKGLIALSVGVSVNQVDGVFAGIGVIGNGEMISLNEWSAIGTEETDGESSRTREDEFGVAVIGEFVVWIATVCGVGHIESTESRNDARSVGVDFKGANI